MIPRLNSHAIVVVVSIFDKNVTESKTVAITPMRCLAIIMVRLRGNSGLVGESVFFIFSPTTFVRFYYVGLLDFAKENFVKSYDVLVSSVEITGFYSRNKLKKIP